MHEIRSSILTGAEKPSTPVARKSKPKSEAASLGSLAKLAIRREEARVTDQRSEDRLPGLVEETIVHFRRKKHMVRVVNVSSRGAMIAFDADDVRIGERIDIQFADENRTRTIVRWVRDGRIGVEFVNEAIFWDRNQKGPVFELHQGGADADQGDPVGAFVDRQPRQTLLRAGTLYWSGISIPVRLKNISATGARVESGHELCPGAEVELDLGEAGFQVAEVRWSKDGQVGLRFAADFDLDSLAPAAAGTAAAAGSGVLKPAYLETETQPDSPWAARFERLSMTDLKMIDPRD